VVTARAGATEKDPQMSHSKIPTKTKFAVPVYGGQRQETDAIY